jgi:lysozyme
MRLSERGLELLREFEGFRDRAYPDPGSRDGLPVTIGYGSTRWEDGTPIELGQTVTRERADEMLRREVAETEGAVDRLVTVPLAQSQFDSLVSFAFNVGLVAFARSTLLRLLNAGDYGGAADQLLHWNKNDGAVMEGLTKRRQRERAMFLLPQHVTERSPVAPAPLEPPPEMPDRQQPASSLPPAPNLPPGKVFPSFPPAPQPTASKPMAPVLAALLPSLVSLLPELGKLFGSGSAVSERNVQAAGKVAEVVIAATQAPNLQGAIEAMERDPDARNAARIAVQAVWYELSESGGGGIDGARKTALAVTAAGDWRSLGFGVTLALLALLIVGGGGYMLWSLIHDPATTPEQRGMLIGALVALIGSPVAFFFGSSVSSRAKDSALVDQLGKR